MPWADEVVRRSENCTIRLIVSRDGGSRAARQSVIDAFHELGVDGEGMKRFRMVALNVPPTADLAEMQRLLDHGVTEEWWHMEARPRQGDPSSRRQARLRVARTTAGHQQARK
ncbi:DUF4265 domain-containing protein [Streptomyces sp. NBC_00243]|uniref:DUF4265 domain-containing protein n=1 Tax=Streptomyces sp. NBC_00243 TaxID=2975688 RepID=UPI002DD8C2EA|nr:DUF4265 domain-containing protein [Streptomyces sp. NBC_00243]WRZ25934.1 DUF4265 domain-containing protein [Streptomyces sp. NBC_00243]